jgi:hypothetical protein
VEVAGDACVGTVGGAGDALEGLQEELRGTKASGEWDRLIAQLGFGVEEDGFVDEVLVDETFVEVGAAFEQQAEYIAFGEGGEDDGKVEAAVAIGYLIDFDTEICKGCASVVGGGFPAEDEEVGFGVWGTACGSDELRVERDAEVSVEDDAEEWTSAVEVLGPEDAAAIGELGVVGKHGADAGEDSVGGMAEELDLMASGRAGEPVGLVEMARGRRRREFAVGGESGFEGDEGGAVLDKVSKGFVEVSGGLFEDAESDFDACGTHSLDPLAADLWIWVFGGDDATGDACGYEGIGAGRCAAMMAAGFEGDIGGGSAGRDVVGCGLFESYDFGVVAVVVEVRSFADDLWCAAGDRCLCEHAPYLGVW